MIKKNPRNVTFMNERIPSEIPAIVSLCTL